MGTSKKDKLAYIVLGVIAVIFLSKFIFNPGLLLERNNDLLELRNVYLYFKDSILQNKAFPLWQNRILSGSPFIGDPQNPLLYLPNYLIFILNQDVFFLVFFMLHFFIGAFGAYFLARICRFSIRASLITAIIYSLSPKFIAHLEAGHINMLAAYGWFPFFIAALVKIRKKPNFQTAILLAVSASAMFLNYATIFMLAVPAGLFISLSGLKTKKFKPVLAYLFLSLLMFIILTGPQLYGLAKITSLTTRNLIVLEDIGPIILSVKKFLLSLAFPYISFENQQTETVLFPGITALVLSLSGFFILSKKRKILLGVLGIFALLIILNNKTLFLNWLLSFFPFFYYFRITTRFWFIVIMVIALLSGLFIDKKIKSGLLVLFIGFLVICESSYFASRYFSAKYQPVTPPKDINYLIKKTINDEGFYRIYCPNSCRDIFYQYGKGGVSGYNPIQLRIFYDFFQTAAGFKFGSYTLILPPYQTIVDQPQPLAYKMGIIGVKYLISSYPYTDSNFKLIENYQGLYLYQNSLIRPRVYINNNNKISQVPLFMDIPGRLKIQTKGLKGRLVVNEIYTPDWQAYDDKGRRLNISREENIVLGVDLVDNVDMVTINYLPEFTGTAILLSLAGWLGLNSVLIILFIRKII